MLEFVRHEDIEINDVLKNVVIVETRTYEAVSDRSTGKLYAVDKQCNNPLYCKDLHITRKTDTCLADIRKELTALDPAFADVKISVNYPLNSDISEDEKFSGTVIYGTHYRAVKPDYNRPIVVEGECTPESRAKAISEACKIRGKLTYFINVLPETDKALFDLRAHYIASDAIQHVDNKQD